jgi:predicted transposase/invertase (TIGR01784 family)
MKTDKLFYRIFISQPSLISELLPGIPTDCEFDYSAPVVKEVEVRMDGLLSPISNDLNLPLVFLEAQMQNDSDFYGRFFAGIFLYLRQYKADRPWRGLLILHRRSQDLGLETPYELQLEVQVQRLYLEDLLPVVGLSPNLAILRLLILPDLEVSAAAQDILHNTPTEAEFQRRLDLVEAILVNKFPQLSVEEVRMMLNLREANFTQTRFYQEVLEKGLQQGLQEGVQQGLQEGVQQGLQEGVQQGEASALLRILKHRCGELSIDRQNQVRSLSIEQLESLADVLLDFTGITDLDNWLQVQVHSDT